MPYSAKAHYVERIYGSGEVLERVEQQAARVVEQLRTGDDWSLSSLSGHTAVVACQTPATQRIGDPFPELEALDIVVLTPEWADMKAVELLRTRVWNAIAPFNRSEMDAILALNPLTLFEATEQHSGTLSNETVWIHDHLLLERVSLLITLEKIGMDPRSAVVFAKSDKTLFGHRVARTLEERGYTTVVGNAFDRSEIIDAPNPTCVIDDGGALIKHLMNCSEGNDPRRTMIETTSKGMKALRLGGYADAVIDLASSDVKLGLSRAIASSFVRQILTMSQHLGMDGTRALVFGFGNLGARVTEQLTAHGLRCSVVEPDPWQRATARTMGYPAAQCIDDVPPGIFDWMVGCSGTPSINSDALSRLRDGGRLCSVASNDLAPVFSEFGDRMREVPYGHVFEIAGSTVRVLGDGHALNLFRSEGVPESDFDRFQAEIVRTLAAAVSDHTAPIAEHSR